MGRTSTKSTLMECMRAACDEGRISFEVVQNFKLSDLPTLMYRALTRKKNVIFGLDPDGDTVMCISVEYMTDSLYNRLMLHLEKQGLETTDLEYSDRNYAIFSISA